ncbi:MAG: hypothetical protein QM727_12640 [Niabella sp.]
MGLFLALAKDESMANADGLRRLAGNPFAQRSKRLQAGGGLMLIDVLLPTAPKK